ncbi:MAG: polyamine aminopropyltransferase [Candidatus Aminicenantales bacterium]
MYNGGMVKDGAYFIEPFTADFFRNFHIEKIIYEGKTKFQVVHIFTNRVFGKVLFLDRRIQSAQIDEFIFHESLVHPALLLHPAPQKVLILGGGEGATLREVLRHPSVQKAAMVDIDHELVKLCRRYLPEWSRGAFSDGRSRLLFQDARRFVEKTAERYDVIISDLTEPLAGGPSVYLFTLEFFRCIAQILTDDGVFVLQAGSTDPHYHRFFTSLSRTLREVFPVVRPYWAFMFSFGLPWGFILASKSYDPVALDATAIGRRFQERKLRRLRYLHPAMMTSIFILPTYIITSLKKADILTDQKPFIWQA